MPAPMLSFSERELLRAQREWGCNCGPSALAACCGLSLEAARDALVRFEDVGYVNSGDMRDALKLLGMRVTEEHSDGTGELNKYPFHGLCLVQFGGPWINGPRPSPKWAMRHTHWIASKRLDDGVWVFDCNQLGWRTLHQWDKETIPEIVASDKLRERDFWLINSWEVRKPRK